MERISSSQVPRGVFKGRNFMTPVVLGFFRGVVRGETCFIELSRDDQEGGGPFGPMFGVTVRHPNGDRLEDDPSCCFSTKESALDFINSGCEPLDDLS